MRNLFSDLPAARLESRGPLKAVIISSLAGWWSGLYFTFNMWTNRASFLILLALAVNHLIYGFGCWGLQPGGSFSANLYLMQMVITVIATALACHALIKSKPLNWVWLTGIIGIGLAVTAGTFCFSGYWIFTSAHLQGIENLGPFFSATATDFVAGYIRLHAMRQASIS